MILFICTGNTCRSPMAEAFYNKLHGGGAQSRGLYVAGASGANPKAIAAAAKYGADVTSHEARQLTSADLASAESIYTMTRAQAEELRAVLPALRDKIAPLADRDISDPYGGSEADYDRAAKEIYSAVERLAGERE